MFGKDAESGSGFVPLSRNRLKELRLLGSKNHRERLGLFLAEGVRLCEEAAAAAPVRSVVVTPQAAEEPRIAVLLQECRRRGLPIYSTSVANYRSFSDEPSPSGIAMTVEIRRRAFDAPSAPFILAVDALQDPGNLGTLLRSAAWFGVKRIWLGRGCVDLYAPKTVRASMGAIFHLDVEEDVVLSERAEQAARAGYRLLAADPQGLESLAELTPSGRDLLLVGSEAHGLEPELVRKADVVFSIPKTGFGESLNAAVAASICFYHFGRASDVRQSV